HRRFKKLLGLGQALDVIDVSVGGDERLALAERKVELADKLNALVDGVFVANVNESPFLVVINQIDRARKPPLSLVVQLDDMRKQGGSCNHGANRGTIRSRREAERDAGRAAAGHGQSEF